MAPHSAIRRGAKRFLKDSPINMFRKKNGGAADKGRRQETREICHKKRNRWCGPKKKPSLILKRATEREKKKEATSRKGTQLHAIRREKRGWPAFKEQSKKEPKVYICSFSASIRAEKKTGCVASIEGTRKGRKGPPFRRRRRRRQCDMGGKKFGQHRHQEKGVGLKRGKDHRGISQCFHD